jgi:hypothetical protein
MRKYDPLADYLRTLKLTERRMMFAEIEEIIGSKLPPTALKRAQWWENDPSPSRQSYAWLKEGWITGDVDVGGGKVTFRRPHSG